MNQRPHLTIQRLCPIAILGAGLLNQAAQGSVTDTRAFTSGFINAGIITDGDLSGWQDTRTITGTGIAQITSVQVSLQISSGYNGDLYAYVSHGSGFAVLLNRVGVGQASGDAFGYADAGMNITLSSGNGFPNIHNYGGGTIPTGTFQPDGRTLDPLSAPAAFDTATTSANLDTFSGLDPHGDWTLFIADVSGGGGQSVVTGWGVSITGSAASVPEPKNSVGVVAAVLLTTFGLLRFSENAQTRLRLPSTR